MDQVATGIEANERTERAPRPGGSPPASSFTNRETDDHSLQIAAAERRRQHKAWTLIVWHYVTEPGWYWHALRVSGNAVFMCIWTHRTGWSNAAGRRDRGGWCDGCTFNVHGFCTPGSDLDCRCGHHPAARLRYKLWLAAFECPIGRFPGTHRGSGFPIAASILAGVLWWLVWIT